MYFTLFAYYSLILLFHCIISQVWFTVLQTENEFKLMLNKIISPFWCDLSIIQDETLLQIQALESSSQPPDHPRTIEKLTYEQLQSNAVLEFRSLVAVLTKLQLISFMPLIVSLQSDIINQPSSTHSSAIQSPPKAINKCLNPLVQRHRKLRIANFGESPKKKKR